MIKKINSDYYLDTYKRADKEALIKWLQERAIFETTLRIPFPYEPEHADEWIDFCLNDSDMSRLPVFAAIRDKDGLLIGSIGLEKAQASSTKIAEIGYWLAKPYWGRSIITQAIKSMCDFGFDQLYLERIYATVFTYNPASKRALEKCGFKYEGLLRKHKDKNGILLDSYVFGLLRSEFQAAMKTNIHIREFNEKDIDIIVDCFAKHRWQKPRSTFENYLKEQQAGTRQIWVAWQKDQLAGFVTLNWSSNYEPFRTKNVPEIMDLNVLPPYRQLGIGSRLIEIAENHAAKRVLIIGIGVGLYDGYGDAQRLYVRRGYVPDGRGPTYRYKQLHYGQSVIVDDDLVMWFTKPL